MGRIFFWENISARALLISSSYDPSVWSCACGGVSANAARGETVRRIHPHQPEKLLFKNAIKNCKRISEKLLIKSGIKLKSSHIGKKWRLKMQQKKFVHAFFLVFRQASLRMSLRLRAKKLSILILRGFRAFCFNRGLHQAHVSPLDQCVTVSDRVTCVASLPNTTARRSILKKKNFRKISQISSKKFDGKWDS